MLRYVGNFITDIWSSSLRVHLYTCNMCRFLFILKDISFLIHLKLNKYQLNYLAVLIVLFKTYVVLDLNKTYRNVFFFDGSNFYSWSSLWFPCLIIFDMKSKKVKNNYWFIAMTFSYLCRRHHNWLLVKNNDYYKTQIKLTSTCIISRRLVSTSLDAGGEI